MSYTLDKENFKNAAKRLHSSLGKKTGLNYNQFLQELSQAFFCKPYEEIKVTVLEKNNITTVKEHGVLLVNYGSEYFLFLVKDNEIHYVQQLCVGTDMEIPYDVLESQAQSLANINDTTVLCIDLPKYLADDYENDDLINFCKQLGLHNTSQSLFLKLLWNKDKHVFINDIIVDQNTLNGDWFEQIDLDYDSAIYTPESIDKLNRHEYFFDIEDIMKSEFIDKNKWQIKYAEDCFLTIEFK